MARHLFSFRTTWRQCAAFVTGVWLCTRENLFLRVHLPEAVVAYSDAVRQAARENHSKKVPIEGGLSQRVMTFGAEIEKVTLLNEKRQPAAVLAVRHHGDHSCGCIV
jgi:hypothetical protein